MELQLPFWFEATTIAVLTVIIVGDLVLAYLRPRVPSTRESAIWVGVYVGLALVFAVLMYFVAGADHAGQFVAGWLTEYSLSIDNLFVFVIIMARFAVPRVNQQEILMVGIIIALVLRAIFIVLGAQLIDHFSWIFYIFGAFLLYTAVRQAFEGSAEKNDKESGVIRLLRRRVHITKQFDGSHIRATVNGKRVLTPVIVVFIALGSTDLVFALDSIPAIFGITTSPFIVFTANVFALMGLRQLFFLLGDLIERLVYLKYGIAFILAFIGVKLVLHALHENQLPFLNGGKGYDWAPEIPIVVSLAVIVVAMGIAVGASLVRLRLDARSGDNGTAGKEVS
jgi:tellurite resistance protein TerC